MSHVEPFHYDFLGQKGNALEKSEELFWVLFAYDKRDPLDHQAEVSYVTEEEVWQEREQKRF